MLPFENIKREIITKKKAQTSLKYGKAPEERTAEELVNYGIVNIDKPKGPTSHQISAYVQNILKISKSGHSGTLDPGVTGVLPIALGRATRVVEFLLKAGKEYVALMHLHKELPEGKIRNAFAEFTGKIMQLPPIKSSVKRELREREIYYIKIIEIDSKDVLFKIGCQAGTYIRKYCHDFGQKLGIGAHMSELRRTKAGPFNEGTIVTLQDLTDAFYYFENGNGTYLKYCIQPIENAVVHLPKIWVLDSAVEPLCHGSDLKMPGIAKFETGIEKDNDAAIMTLKNELICVGKARMTSEEMGKNEKGVAVKIEKVFMMPGSYPKITI